MGRDAVCLLQKNLRGFPKGARSHVGAPAPPTAESVGSPVGVSHDDADLIASDAQRLCRQGGQHGLEALARCGNADRYHRGPVGIHPDGTRVEGGPVSAGQKIRRGNTLDVVDHT